MTEWICGNCYGRCLGKVAGLCPVCGAAGLVPVVSPRGAQLAAAAAAPVLSGPAVAVSGSARPVPQAAILAVVLSIVAAIGVFMPWASMGFRSLSGTEGQDGMVALVALILPLLIGIVGLSGRTVSRTGGLGLLLSGGICVAISLVDGAKMLELAERNELVSAGAGLYVLGIASGLLGFVGLYTLLVGSEAARRAR